VLFDYGSFRLFFDKNWLGPLGVKISPVHVLSFCEPNMFQKENPNLPPLTDWITSLLKISSRLDFWNLA